MSHLTLAPLSMKGPLAFRSTAFAARVLVFLLGRFSLLITPAMAQTDVAAWGTISGIRVEGQRFEINSRIRLVRADGTSYVETAKERQRPRFSREGNRWTVETHLAPLSITQIVEDVGPGQATIDFTYAAQADSQITGLYVVMDLPADDYVSGTVVTLDAPEGPGGPLGIGADTSGEILRTVTRGLQFNSATRRLDLGFGAPTEVAVKRLKDLDGDVVQIQITLVSGALKKDLTGGLILSLHGSGEIDREPVSVRLEADRPGRAFDGLGGNFRIQNPNTDPAVIAHNLENLRVAWGRVEMPWGLWHPEEGVDPLEVARAGDIHPRVHAAMEMAQRLAALGMPVIVGAWFPPAWAVIGDPRTAMQPQPGGLLGNPLNPEKMDRILESLGSYLLHLKEAYGVEAVMFSFNESDLGINVRQTAEDHALLNKQLGAHLASRGLATRMLLGDTSDARPLYFLEPSLEDPETWPFIGAVSFHSWRGCTDERLRLWSEAARRLNVPLLVGEGSTDAAAWTYPTIFQEFSFAHDEIILYARILALSQPLSILQWQLTADYSLLAGGGVFGQEGPLRPTQRFWNLKQIASTPEGAFYLPIASDRTDVYPVAFGNIARGQYAVHLVNDGAAREAIVTGFPEDVTELRLFVTDRTRGMEEGARVPVSGGEARFVLDGAAFVTAISG